jgi:hypothetical protein
MSGVCLLDVDSVSPVGGEATELVRHRIWGGVRHPRNVRRLAGMVVPVGIIG